MVLPHLSGVVRAVSVVSTTNTARSSASGAPAIDETGGSPLNRGSMATGAVRPPFDDQPYQTGRSPRPKWPRASRAKASGYCAAATRLCRSQSEIDALVGDRHDGGVFVLALMILGIMEASMTRRPSIPLTRKSGVTTVVGSSALPIRQVPTGESCSASSLSCIRRAPRRPPLSPVPGDSSSSTMSTNGGRCNDRPEIFQRLQQPPRVCRNRSSNSDQPARHPLAAPISSGRTVGKRTNQMARSVTALRGLDRQCRPQQTNAIDWISGGPVGYRPKLTNAIVSDPVEAIGPVPNRGILNEVPDQLDPCVLAEITKRALGRKRQKTSL